MLLNSLALEMSVPSLGGLRVRIKTCCLAGIVSDMLALSITPTFSPQQVENAATTCRTAMISLPITNVKE